MSDAQLISADILLSKRAKVTFFSSLGSAVESCRESIFEPTIVDDELSLNAVSRTSSESRDERYEWLELSDSCINSPNVT